ncbi:MULTISPECIES: hypothetical protein [Streptomyces]|uniref:Secreted protein n=1 Tax=Streptomyces caniscabiei TaxID=2746961 RepID=A0ABU4MW75_9ACTN|nr:MULTISPECIES: hypothetical protein [Streptomyces]MBE4739455.1 hypothetical protein [Streptomyces caniscabiei]MBE4759977.1 hypothetical protein [Streptomyces caniscabiei]MBE4772681.1 hypothetical protein [Streptomyces caniscabiei]MBE4784611.1 hypothetical protein [Streptomyces caniscabiei]MBE4798145.1 hypothetical protein [Streptomyces caniscabiei]
MQRLITKALTTAAVTAALIATAVGITSTDTGRTPSNGHSVSAACWPNTPCWKGWDDRG